MSPKRKILKQRRIVFVVEDDPDYRNILVASIQHHFENAACFGFESAEECLRTLKNIRPNLIIMDISMPGMNGIEACKEIHAIEGLQALPVILTSGMDPKAIGPNAIEESGASAFLPKPFEVSAVMAWIEKLVDSGETFA